MNGEDLRVKSTQESANVHAAIDKYGWSKKEVYQESRKWKSFISAYPSEKKI